MQPHKQPSRLDFAIIAIVILIIIAGAYYFLVVRNQQPETSLTQEEPHLLTEEEIDARVNGTKIEVPVEDTIPREKDPVTGEYREVEESGEKVEIYIPIDDSIGGIL